MDRTRMHGMIANFGLIYGIRSGRRTGPFRPEEWATLMDGTQRMADGLEPLFVSRFRRRVKMPR